ncbi:MAG: alpha/beta fold hydrolase, partial [Myxococcota bacterium]|nr:alpha/beta fold hydrolase [Myxococcota bacterium]
RPGDAHPLDFFHLDRGGSYSLMVGPGPLRILAFRDGNHDRVRQPDEPYAWLHEDDPVVIGDRVRNTGFDGELPARSDGSLEPRIDLSDLDLDRPRSLGEPAGTRVDLDDGRFSRANAQKGLWRPMEFLVDVGGALFFLEPFDPDRVPVIFVHGIAGTPAEFESLIDRLDTGRFQPWVLHYPSGIRLEPVADYLHATLLDLEGRLEFRRVMLVAHSMGGLVARAALTELHHAGRTDLVPLLVTISTPWGGHAAAASGVERSPVVLPVWRDMKPGSPFLQALHRERMPEEVDFRLFFGFEGHRRRSRAGGANDGVVAIASQLLPAAQDEASALRGFPANHTGILRLPEVAEALNEALAEADTR